MYMRIMHEIWSLHQLLYTLHVQGPEWSNSVCVWSARSGREVTWYYNCEHCKKDEIAVFMGCLRRCQSLCPFNPRQPMKACLGFWISNWHLLYPYRNSYKYLKNIRNCSCDSLTTVSSLHMKFSRLKQQEGKIFNDNISNFASDKPSSALQTLLLSWFLYLKSLSKQPSPPSLLRNRSWRQCLIMIVIKKQTALPALNMFTCNHR